jgi:hypothetical protein
MRMLLTAALLLPVLFQDPEVTAADERERLAEYVEGLDAFTVRYSMFPTDAEPIELELVYSAPDRARMRMKKDAGTMNMWIVDGVLAVLSGDGEKVGFAEFDTRPMFDELRDVRVALNEAFGDGDESALEPRPTFHVHPDDTTDEGGPRFSLEMQLTEGSRSFFCWNGIHRDHFEGEQLEGGHVVLFDEDEHKSLKIARHHSQGFLELAFGEGESGPVTFRLDGVELEADEDELEIPARPEGSDDLTEALAGSMQVAAGPGAVRRRIYGTVRRLLVDGDVEWSDETRELAGEVFATFHRHSLPSHYEEWLEQPRTFIRDAAERLAQQIERGDVGEGELAAAVAGWRETLTGSLNRGEEAYAERLAAPVEGDWADELLELEREVSRTLFVETLTAPLIAEFEDQVESLL